MDDGEYGNTQSARFDSGEYLAILKRRKWFFIIPFVAIVAASTAFAFALPPVYKATATILVEKQEIPTELIQTTVTGYVQERIQALKQRLLTHENLWRVAEEIDYLGTERSAMPQDEVVAAMRDGILVEMVDVEAQEPGGTRPTVVTVAFEVSFEAPVAETASKGANRLAEMYLEEDHKARIQQAAEVTRFLGSQADRLRAEIVELEQQIAEFKKENVGQMPGVADTNLRLLEQTEDRIVQTVDRIRTLEQRRIFLRSQLATTSLTGPMIGDLGEQVLAPQERLRVLRSQYANASAIYGPEHPDLIRMRREIAQLEKQYGGEQGDSAYGELQRLRAQLGAMRERYSDSHPDVRKLMHSIENLREQLADERSGGEAPPPSVIQAPNNPTYIRLQTEMDALDANLQAERSQLENLRAKAADLENRVTTTPIVERDYLALSRDYKNAQAKYSEIKDKMLQSKAAEELEGEHKAQRFSLIGPARVPLLPDRPNRIGIALLGFFLATAGGIGTIATAEYSDHRVRGRADVMSVFGAPPLVAIPYIENAVDISRRRIRVAAAVALVFVGTSVSLGAAHVFWKPIPELFQTGTAGSAPQQAAGEEAGR